MTLSRTGQRPEERPEQRPEETIPPAAVIEEQRVQLANLTFEVTLAKLTIERQRRHILDLEAEITELRERLPEQDDSKE